MGANLLLVLNFVEKWEKLQFSVISANFSPYEQYSYKSLKSPKTPFFSVFGANFWKLDFKAIFPYFPYDLSKNYTKKPNTDSKSGLVALADAIGTTRFRPLYFEKEKINFNFIWELPLKWVGPKKISSP